MQHRLPRRTVVAMLCVAAAAASFAVTGDAPPSPAADAVVTVPGMPPVPDSRDLYSEAGAGKLSAVVADALPRIYVPNVQSNDVYVIDPATMKVVDRFKVGVNPQHVVPSWDLKTLWVANNAEGRTDGSLTPIDPATGKPGRPVVVDDPYNMYFTPDGRSAIIVAEARKRIDFRDAHSMQMQQSLPTPQCDGINHADFSIDGRYAIFTCEFQGSLVKIDLVERKVLGYLKLSKPASKKISFNIRPGIDPNARYPRLARWQAVLYRRYGSRRGVRRRRRHVPANRFHRHRYWHAWPLPKPRWQKTLRRQSRLEQNPRSAAWQGQRFGGRFRHAQGRRNLADPGRRQPGHGQCQRRRQAPVACRTLRQRRLCHRHHNR
jgi:YVTN family beta-propeller protein